MNRFFRRAVESLESEIRFINILERLALKGKIQIRLNKDCIRRPGQPKENYIQIQILETPNRFILFLYKTKIFVVDSVYIYERPQDHKNIYTHLHHILSIGPKEELNGETAVKVFKTWIEEIFNIDIDVIIVDSK